jgi:hypothetical protein
MIAVRQNGRLRQYGFSMSQVWMQLPSQKRERRPAQDQSHQPRWYCPDSLNMHGVGDGIRQLTNSYRFIVGSFCSLSCKRLDDCYVLQQFFGDAVSPLQIGGGIVRNPNFSLGVFPDQNFEG